MNSSIKDKFMLYAPKTWWGDHLDVRFYLVENLKKLRKKRILDVGCGPGVILSELHASNECYGIDFDENSVEIAKKLAPEAKITKNNMFKLPFVDDFFDVVVCAHVLPFADFEVKDFEVDWMGVSKEKKRFIAQVELITEVVRVLKLGGKMFFTTPNRVYYKNPVKANYEEVDNLLKLYFDYEIRGYNPFPSFPWFFPARALCKIPGWRSLLAFLSEKGVKTESSKSFFIKAIKK